ncbi:MAG: AAA family ATPase [Muribaculaceae bacterium]|nr:AAA family ATPase [Muribaculaceae bacterium]
MTHEIKYPVGIQSFSEIITGGYVYVDKTMYVRKMIDTGKYYFLSRPRRFGKSLFLTTLEAYFEGRRDLFKGLALDTDDVDWTPKPVIKFSFNAIRPTEKENLDKYLNATLSDYERKYEVKYILGDFTDRFASIIRQAKEKTGQNVAILVDEYDALLLSTLEPEKEEFNSYYRQTLKSLFSVLKNEDQSIYFVFITGISRFSQTSLFSGANHLEDISIFNDYGAICGITEQELHDNFKAGIEKFAEEEGIEFDEMLAELKENYDGYHFSKKCPDLYNPFSILRTLKSREIDNY